MHAWVKGKGREETRGERVSIRFEKKKEEEEERSIVDWLCLLSIVIRTPTSSSSYFNPGLFCLLLEPNRTLGSEGCGWNGMGLGYFCKKKRRNEGKSRS